jgi:hypothetical protein
MMGILDHIINDETVNDALLFGGHRGLDLSSRPEGLIYTGLAEPFPDSLLIPSSEWQSRIAENEERKTALNDLVDLAGLPCKDQDRTNYCWGNATVHTGEIVRVLQNQPKVILSAASVCGPVTRYANARPWPGQPAGVGGNGINALNYIIENGIVPESNWPVNVIDPKYATAANKNIALDYRVDEWFEIEPGNMNQVVSCLLRNIPISVGLNWWGHQITYYAAKWVDGAIAILFRNSWGKTYGQNGYGILQGRRMLPSDAIAPRTMKAAA